MRTCVCSCVREEEIKMGKKIEVRGKKIEVRGKYKKGKKVNGKRKGNKMRYIEGEKNRKWKWKETKKI